MKKLKIIPILLLALFQVMTLSGQNADSLRIVSFEKAHSNLNYQKLMQKYANPVLTVDTVELEYLYYLKYKNAGFSYYNLSSEERTFRDSYESRQFQRSAELGLQLLQSDPTDLTTIIYVATSLKKINKPDSSTALFKRYDQLLKIINRYGDGRSAESSFRVAKISDEYAILKHTKDMFYNRKTIQEPDCIIDSWNVFSPKSSENYDLHFRFNNLYIHAND